MIADDELWADLCPTCHHHDPDREHGNVGCESDIPPPVTYKGTVLFGQVCLEVEPCSTT